MSLTKQECEKSLSFLKEQYEYLKCMMSSNYPYTIEMLTNVYRCFEQLINEHFYNPPLKFEEIKEKMWVWDNKTKSYIFIFKPLNWEPIKGLRYAHQIINHSAYGYYMDFEENRFYRYEVGER